MMKYRQLLQNNPTSGVPFSSHKDFHSGIFFGYGKEDFHRRLWTLLLSGYLYLSCILDYALSLQGSRLFWGSPVLGPANPSWFFISSLMAVLCAFQGFSYLFSETQCDFYYTLPLKRSRLLIAGYLNGLLIGLLPCIIGRFTCLVIEGSFSSSARYYTGMGMLVSVIGFLLIYHMALVIQFLSGRVLVAIAAMLLTLAYGPVTFGFIIRKYSTLFFDTYYREDFIDTLAVYTSPYTLYQAFAGVQESSGSDDWTLSAHTGPLTAAVLFLIVLFFLAAVLFQKRPAENCGKVLTFPKAEFPLKSILTIPAALLCGCYFMGLSLDAHSFVWLVIGIIFSAFTIHGLLEIFFRFDIRGMISKKRQMLFISVFSLLIASSFYFDWWRYDSYTPAIENVAAIAVSPSGLDDNSWQSEDIIDSFPISDITDSRLNTMRLTGDNKQIALDWLESLHRRFLTDSAEDRTPLSYAAAAYILENGKTVYRKYPIYDTIALDEFASVYDMEEYKTGTNSLASHETTGRQHFVWSNGLETYHLDLSYEENEALLSAYKEDLAGLSLDTLKQELPVGKLSLSYGNYGGGDSGLLYPCFTHTLDLLEENGIPARKTLSADYEICGLQLYEIAEDVSVHSAPEKKKVLIEDITGPAELQKLQPWLLYAGFAVNPILNPVDTGYEVTVLFRDSRGQTYDYADAYLKLGSPIE